ncbi:peptide ABC transporter substrate-binding protein [Cardiobacteriaceae bacterium TAE3-ERU3]|nr:peptide ABC transporter substrate-binding protein [Cardiobacteriaceae bacterium TAE3-ERU3]
MKRFFPTALALAIAIAGSAHAAGMLQRDNGAEPASIDPQLASEDAGHRILIDTFEGLTATGPEGGIIPGVAESWETSEDGKTWLFHLRDTTWSDGTPLTAHDFVYGWQRAVDPATGSTYAFVLFPVKNAEAIANGEIKDLDQLGIKALDDHTLQVELENPTPYFAQLLNHYTTYPAPRHVIEQYGKEWTQPEHIVSNGAFHITDWTPQASITAKKSDTYWDKDNVSLDGVVYHSIENQSSSLARYRAGELDIGSVPIDQLDWVRNNLADEVLTYDFLGTYFYGMNLTKAPFKDNPKLRRALSMAIDRNILIDKVIRGGQTPAYSIVPPLTDNSKPYQPEWASLPRGEQIAEAKKLFAEAGYGPDNPLKLELLYNTNEDHKKIAIAIASMWKQILGVETELLNQEWKVMLSTLRQGDSQIYRSAWYGDYNDPNTFLEVFTSGSEENYGRYSDPQFDQLVSDGAKEQDLQKRAQILYNAAKTFADADGIIPLYHYVKINLVKPNIKGVNPDIMGVIPARYITKEE